jgi:hypothetical protein
MDHAGGFVFEDSFTVSKEEMQHREAEWQKANGKRPTKKL